MNSNWLIEWVDGTTSTWPASLWKATDLLNMPKIRVFTLV
jgi:hypothetical protein